MTTTRHCVVVNEVRRRVSRIRHFLVVANTETRNAQRPELPTKRRGSGAPRPTDSRTDGGLGEAECRRAVDAAAAQDSRPRRRRHAPRQSPALASRDRDEGDRPVPEVVVRRDGVKRGRRPSLADGRRVRLDDRIPGRRRRRPLPGSKSDLPSARLPAGADAPSASSRCAKRRQQVRPVAVAPRQTRRPPTQIRSTSSPSPRPQGRSVRLPPTETPLPIIVRLPRQNFLYNVPVGRVPLLAENGPGPVGIGRSNRSQDLRAPPP